MPDQQTPTQSRWRTVKVFISSTFRDMYAERDHLVKVVFPALREKLGKYHVYLIDIDLRWGVTKEQADNDQVLDLCLKLIDDCRPFFIGILGERYGWVPTKIPPEAIKKYGWVQHETGKSLTELEILHGVLNNPDMKGHAFFYFRDPNALSKVPDAVRKEIYVERDPVRIKKLIVLKEGIRRSGHPVMDPYPAQWDAEAYDRYTKAKGRLTGLKEFGDSIQKQLWERIKEELKLPDKPPTDTETDPLAIEQDYHERFIDSRLNVYIGRDKIHKDLLAYCNGDDRRPLIVTGPSGSGKSAILARLSRELMETKTPSPLPSPTRGEGCNISPPLSGDNEGESDVCGSTNEHVSNTTVIPFFVGASPSSTAIRGALQYLCNVIKKKFGLAPEVPAEADKLITTFRSFLFSIPENKRLVIIIDAINQIDETDHPEELAWLPEELAPNVRIVLSCIDEPGHKNRFIERAREMKIAEKRVDELTDNERKEIIRTVPSVSAKTLDKDQIKMLLDNPATKNPLYLLIALEELRGFGSFDELNRRISEFPKPDNQGGDVIQAIFGQVIRRLEEEFDRELVRAVLPLLASARRGLSEKELSELIVDLSGKEDLFPVLRQLRTYLMERGEIIDFFHRGLYKAIHSLYLKDDEDRKVYHLRLANYFEKKEINPRKVDELPWQLCQAESWERLKDCITNISIFLKLMTDATQYELMSYWLSLKDRYDIVECYHESLTRYERKETSEINVSYCLHEVAFFLNLNAQYDGAEPLYRRALEIRERMLGSDHPDTATSLNNLAELLLNKGNYKGAESHYRRALEISERVLGSDHQDTAQSLNNLATLLFDIGDYKGAETLHLRALEIRERMLGSDHPQTASSLNNLALLLRKKGDYDGAEPLYRRALEIRERMLGSDHPDTATSLNNLAELLYDKGDYEGAETLHRRALEIRERMLGSDHPQTASSLNNLAGLLYNKGDYEGVELLFRRALSIWEKTLGKEHPDTITARYNLAQLLRDKGDHKGATPLYRQLIEIHEELLKKHVPILPQILSKIAISHNELAFHTFVPAKDWKEAEFHYRQAIELFSNVPDPIQAANSEMNLQTMYHLSGQPVDVERVKALTRILEEAKDKRAEKGHKILNEISE